MNVINQVNTESYGYLLHKVLKKAYRLTKTSRKKRLTIIIVSTEKMQELNGKYRHKPDPTDVLTFPSEARDELGDVFIALRIAMKQAQDLNHSLERELSFLAVHGFLHTLGYNHETESEAEKMYAMQRKILSAVKL